MSTARRTDTRDPVPMTSSQYLRWLNRKRRPEPIKLLTDEELVAIAERMGWNRPIKK